MRVETVAAERVVPRLVVPGIVEAKSRIELGFRVSGFVARFGVEEGDRVEAGAVIAELDASDLERELRAAQAPGAILGQGDQCQARDVERIGQRDLEAAHSRRFWRIDLRGLGEPDLRDL